MHMRILLLAFFAPSSAFAATWYADADADGYGDPAASTEADTAPAGYVATGDDCDDLRADVNPAAIETCDGVDDDCDDATDEDGVCPCDVETQDGNTYMFCTSPETWDDALATCESYGYSLASVASADENAWLDVEVDSRTTQKWWFGFNDQDTEGTFVWADGSDVLYTNWHSGEPNNAGSGEDCTQLNRWAGGDWNDEPCGSPFPYVCEAGTLREIWTDADGDGQGEAGSTSSVATDVPDGWASNDDDCDDADATIYTGATEIAGDGIDQDCDGVDTPLDDGDEIGRAHV